VASLEWRKDTIPCSCRNPSSGPSGTSAFGPGGDGALSPTSRRRHNGSASRSGFRRISG
jgi:hypothetical protein